MYANKLIKTAINDKSFEWYMKLLDKSYRECIVLLHQKYGEVKDDYFKQKSFYKFLEGEIKNIGKGKYSRASDGLECHHIFEKEYMWLCNQAEIKANKYPYKLHKKENLVYCDICEHFILHTLITKETNGEFGDGGNETYLKPKIRDWLVFGEIPKPEWMKECIRRVSLTSDQAHCLLKKSEGMLKETKERRRKEYEQQRDQEIKEYHAKERNMSLKEYEEFLKLQEEAKKALQEKRKLEMQEEFYGKYPKFRKMNIPYTTTRSRDKILNVLYKCKYKDIYPDKRAFKSAMINIVRQDLLKMLDDIQK